MRTPAIQPPACPHLQVLGLQRSERLLPCRAARRSLLRAAADPAAGERVMQLAYTGQHPSLHREAHPGTASASRPASPDGTGAASTQAQPAAAELDGAGCEAALPAAVAGAAVAEGSSQAQRLRDEVSACGASPFGSDG